MLRQWDHHAGGAGRAGFACLVEESESLVTGEIGQTEDGEFFAAFSAEDFSFCGTKTAGDNGANISKDGTAHGGAELK